MYRNAALESYIYQSCDLKNIQLGDHVCFFYQNDKDKNIIVDYIIQGLELNQKVVCITHSKDYKSILILLENFQFKFQNYVDNKQLIFITIDSLLENNILNYQAFVDFYKKISEEALKEGYSFLRIYNDMSWVKDFLDQKENFVKLEAILTEDFYKQSPTIGFCGFQKDLFSSNFLNNLLEAYELFYLDHKICPNNFYIPAKISCLEQNDKDLLEYKIARIKENKYRERQISHIYKQTEELRDFSHMIAHDLKGPLRRVNVLNDIIKTEYVSVLDNAVLNLHDKLSYSLKDMNDRMNGLIELTNLTNQKNFKRQKINTLIAESTYYFETELSEFEGNFQLNLREDILPLELSRDLILQLFENIFNNSIKFRKKDEKLLIKIESTKDEYDNVQVVISDNGVGFNSQFKGHIFKPFQRLHLDHEYEGQGMGLAICHRIMQKHKGSIMAEGCENQGATITLIFPKPDVPSNLST
ncbi:MAG: MEDS domain-containing protein [Janthinobacterium lividum]